jgi:hypothetical protein
MEPHAFCIVVCSTQGDARWDRLHDQEVMSVSQIIKKTHERHSSRGMKISLSARSTPNSSLQTAVKIARMFGQHSSLADTMYMVRMGYGGY